MMRIARHVRVVGRVQGVFFRAWTREHARRLQVDGWVRNCSDGSVEAELEGRQNAVLELIDLLREGPSGAKVDAVQIEETKPEGFGSFEVRH